MNCFFSHFLKTSVSYLHLIYIFFIFQQHCCWFTFQKDYVFHSALLQFKSKNSITPTEHRVEFIPSKFVRNLYCFNANISIQMHQYKCISLQIKVNSHFDLCLYLENLNRNFGNFLIFRQQ